MANGERPIRTYKDRSIEDVSYLATSLFNKNSQWPPPDDGESVAKQVIEDFDLPKTTNINFGSSLPGYDINNRDPYRMIQLSLAASAFGDNEDLKECYVNEKGEIDFYTLGKGEEISDIYYSIPSESYKLPCNSVVVTGCEIPPVRETRPSENLFTLGNLDTFEPDEKGPWHIAFGKIVPMKNEYQEGWIEYNRIEEGDRYKYRKDVWDVKDFERIITWIYNIRPYQEFDSSYSDIQFRNTSTRYYPLTSFGNMVEGQILRRPIISTEAGAMYSEMLDSTIIENGVKLPIATKSKFLGVKRILIYGIKLNRVEFYHDNEGKPSEPHVYIDTLQPSLFALRRGEDYVINKNENKELIITFANNVIREDKRGFFGKDVDDYSEKKFRIHSGSITREMEAERKVADPAVTVVGVLKDGYSQAEGGQILEFPSVFPVGFGESGYAVKNLLVEVEWDNPCVYVKDTRNIVTEELLGRIEIDIFPVVLDDRPAPMAHNGELVLAEEDKPDEDPTSQEIFGRTEKQQILDSMRGGDLNITLPFLNAEQAITASQKILELKQEDIQETSYTCGPECFPTLGAAAPEEGVINSITYSYQDNSQYVVNVQCGPIWQGMGGWGQSVNEAMTSQLSLDGMVVRAHKNNIDFLVNVNRIGLIPCVNAIKDVICNGDKVKVTVYNNPVGER